MNGKYEDHCNDQDQIFEDVTSIQSSIIDSQNEVACEKYASFPESIQLPVSLTPDTTRERKWHYMYNELVKFKSREGHCNVPYRYTKNYKLGTWVGTQRRSYKKKIMGTKSSISPHHYHLLTAIGFLWKAPVSGGPKHNDTKWLKRFDDLKAFKAEYGHCNVPQKYTENPKLGIWVHRQRSELRKILNGCLAELNLSDNKSYINEDRIRALESIGFVWREESSRYKHDDASWMKRFDELLDFRAKHGHIKVPYNKSEYDGLRNWVRKQRYNYNLFAKGRPTAFTECRKILLDKIGLMEK